MNCILKFTYISVIQHLRHKHKSNVIYLPEYCFLSLLSCLELLPSNLFLSFLDDLCSLFLYLSLESCFSLWESFVSFKHLQFLNLFILSITTSEFSVFVYLSLVILLFLLNVKLSILQGIYH